MKMQNRLGEWAKRFGFIGIGACGICCLAPILFTGLGLSALGWIFSASEWIGILGFLLSAGLFGIYRLRKKANPSCSVDCACREKEPKEQ